MIKKGTMFCLTAGEYSDYRLGKFLVALLDFDPAQYNRRAKEIYGDRNHTAYLDETDAYCHALMEKGLVQVLRCETLHVGAYGDFEAGKVKR